MKRLLFAALPLSLSLAVSACSCRPAGTCATNADCSKPQLCCSGACKDVTSDPQNCGACGLVCSSTNTSATCSEGQCQLACNAGFGDCDQNPRDGCEVALTTANNCGSCGNVCSFHNAQGTCPSGACAMGGCNSGFADCNSDPNDGCETDIHNSLTNCGACGRTCSGVNATPRCQSGVCRPSCNTGFGDCNLDPTDGCETNLSTSAKHCGDCNIACPSGQVCTAGNCAPATLILYGGLDDIAATTPTPTADVWQVDPSSDGGAFTKLAPTGTGPGARWGHGAAWDATNQRMLVFGGVTGTTVADTKIYALDFSSDPPAWKVVAASGTAPSPRWSSVVSIDQDAGVFYVYGGSVLAGMGSQSVGDFYQFDLNAGAWKQLSPGGVNAPAPRDDAAGCFDPSTRQFALFGGGDANLGTAVGDGWTWDTSAATPAWTKLVAATNPTARIGAAMSGIGPLFMFGGAADDGMGGLASVDETWQLTLGTAPEWKDVSGTTRPTSRAFQAQAWNGKALVVFGGASFPAGAVNPMSLDDLWTFDPSTTTWTQVSADGAPGAPAGNKVLGTLISRQ